MGKVPGEIIIVGGGSIMLNYTLRDATQDFDVILKTVSGITDIIKKFADENGLPRDWMNTDFIKTSSYSDMLSEVSKHLWTLNNGTLEIRTVSGVYLIATKLIAHRDYRNDISDAIGILIEEREAGASITYDDIVKAYQKLYRRDIPEEIAEIVKEFSELPILELKEFYEKKRNSEQDIAGKILTYIDEGADINTRNVEDVIEAIKRKMEERVDEGISDT
ncbi:MAG: DUF6036 family nucleotidyltransferase [Acetatifactor sp.]